MAKSKMTNRPPVAEVRKIVRNLERDGSPYTDGVVEALEWAIDGADHARLTSVIEGDAPVTEIATLPEGQEEHTYKKFLDEMTGEFAVPSVEAPAPAMEFTASIPGDRSIKHLVPSNEFIDTYVSRDVHGGKRDLDVLAAAHEEGFNVLLKGPTGSAKTSFVYAYAASIGKPVVNIACNGAIDMRALLGGWVPTADGSFRFEPGELPLAVEQGGIILLNEVNFMPPKIAAVLYGLLDRRRTLYLPDAAGSDYPTTIVAHPETFVVADFNPGYRGTRPLNEAFENRFAVHLNWDYEDAVESQLVTSASLLEMAVSLRERVLTGELSTAIPTNSLMEFEAMATNGSLGYEFAAHNFTGRFSKLEQPVVSEVLAVYRLRIEIELGLAEPVREAESVPTFASSEPF